ncbi:MAG: hypothetical protein NTY38_29760, partial [Acidobacteria bacterium]|nr:hypothetical protein [Acidobacteriota bacterium]
MAGWLAAAERARPRIRDLRTLTIQGSARTYVLVKVVTGDGAYGVGEAYGTPGVAVKEQILALKPGLLGKNPLEIDVLYSLLDEHASNLAGTRTDGSAHGLLRAASGIEMALWDLAGKVLGVPTATLLGGRYRQKVRVYNHAAPANMLDKTSCREWAGRVREHPSGFTAHKLAFPHADERSRTLTNRELIAIGKGFENCREAIGWDHDI